MNVRKVNHETAIVCLSCEPANRLSFRLLATMEGDPYAYIRIPANEPSFILK